MLSKKILISAVLMLVCGAANAFDFGKWGAVGGQLAGTIGGAIGNTSCTSTKCGAVKVLPETVQKCLSNPATIEKNPNCAGAFFHQQCNPGQNKFVAACRTVANTMGFDYQTNAQRPQQGRQQVQRGINTANQRVQHVQQQGRQQVQQQVNAGNQRAQHVQRQGRQQVQQHVNAARTQQGRQQYNQYQDGYGNDEDQFGHDDQYQDNYGSGQFDEDGYGSDEDQFGHDNQYQDDYGSGQFDEDDYGSDEDQFGHDDQYQDDYDQEQDDY